MQYIVYFYLAAVRVAGGEDEPHDLFVAQHHEIGHHVYGINRRC
jgi:hypothetical protein